MRYCTRCGNALKEKAKFCSSCGNKVTGQSKSRAGESKKEKPAGGKQKEKPGIKVPLPALILGAGILIVLGFLAFAPDSPRQAARQNTPVSAGEQQMLAQIQTVARQFPCPCGDCSDNLAVCDCNSPNGAVEVKRFIRQGLEAGKSVDQMVTAVSLKYNVGSNATHLKTIALSMLQRSGRR